MPSPTAAPTAKAAPPGRDSAVDSLRAGAMLLVVLFHAAIPYAKTPLPGVLWPVSAAPSSRLLDVLLWASHGVQMPLFFLLSGLLAPPALARHGARRFVQGRLRRLGLPLLVPGLPILVLLFYTWGAGWVLEGRSTVKEIRAVKFDDPELASGFLGPAHLWFLRDLVLVSVGWAVLSRLRVPLPVGRRAVVLGTATAACLLFAEPRILTRFDNRFAPDPAGLAYHAAFFLAGTALARPGTDRGTAAPAGTAALPATVAFLGGAAVAYSLLPAVAAGTAGPLERAGFAAAASAFAWSAVLLSVSLARSGTLPTGPALSRLNDAAYWTYLVHLPLVGALQIALAPLGWLPLATWAIAASGALAGALLTWHLVRPTRLGALLAGGPRRE